MLEEYTVVRAKRQLGEKVIRGTTGTILIVHDSSLGVYEVEFIDGDGHYLDLLTVDESDLEI
ncbi:DUF4926 domain-containing protein [Paenibacillus ferrarius]|uniref:DUF4926 domain-containing protein n=1 Tax=Paenibacillus ferrarius TaxID=1469647 RepID=UPI003D29A79E